MIHATGLKTGILGQEHPKRATAVLKALRFFRDLRTRKTLSAKTAKIPTNRKNPPTTLVLNEPMSQHLGVTQAQNLELCLDHDRTVRDSYVISKVRLIRLLDAGFGQRFTFPV